MQSWVSWVKKTGKNESTSRSVTGIKTLASAFILPRFNYCNSLLAKITEEGFNKLQMLQNNTPDGPTAFSFFIFLMTFATLLLSTLMGPSIESSWGSLSLSQSYLDHKLGFLFSSSCSLWLKFWHFIKTLYWLMDSSILIAKNQQTRTVFYKMDNDLRTHFISWSTKAFITR